jgi:hypothetical protein
VLVSYESLARRFGIAVSDHFCFNTVDNVKEMLYSLDSTGFSFLLTWNR